MTAPAAHVWFPDRHSILITLEPDDMFYGTCLCGADAIVADYDSVQAWRVQHRCPPGSLGAWPQCPTCGARGRACVNRVRGRGRGVSRWHGSRTALYVQVTGVEPPVLETTVDLPGGVLSGPDRRRPTETSLSQAVDPTGNQP